MPITPLNNLSPTVNMLNLPNEKELLEEEASKESVLRVGDRLDLSPEMQKAVETAKQFAKIDPVTEEIQQGIRQADAQGNYVQISDLAKSLAANQTGNVAWDYKNPPIQNALSSTTADGDFVAVGQINNGAEKTEYTLRLTGASGQSVNFNFTDNVTIAKNESGAYSVYFAESDSTRVFAEDGSASEIAGNALQTDSGAIYVNVTGGKLTTGNGNSLIFAYADNTVIDGGNGNDKLVLKDNINNITFNAGDGDDSVFCRASVVGSNLHMGSGNNEIGISFLESGQIDAGDGNNLLNINTATGASKINLGNGDNKLNISSAGASDHPLFMYLSSEQVRQDARTYINLGNGNNSISGQNIHGDISMGDGNNSINYHQISTAGSLRLGNGDNSINMYSVERGGKLDVGDGNNHLDIHTLRDDAVISLGNGDNSVHMYDVRDKAVFTLGNGENSLDMYAVKGDGKLVLGNGNNQVQMYRTDNRGSVIFGNGNNTMSIWRVEGESAISFGDGANRLDIGSLKNESNVSLGDGANLIFLKALSDNAKLNIGDGDNTVIADTITDNAALNMGDGDNIFFASKLLGNAAVMGGIGNNLFLYKTLIDANINGGKNTAIMNVDREKSGSSQWDMRISERNLSDSLNMDKLSETIDQIFNSALDNFNNKSW